MQDVRLKEKEEEAQVKAQSLGLPYVNLKGFPISPEALSLVSEEQSTALKVVCFLHTGSEIRVAAVNPEDEKIKELLFQLTERYKANGAIYQITEESFRLAKKAYANLPKIKLIIKGVKITDTELEKFQSAMATFADIQKTVQGASVTDVMTIVIAAALKFDSSDIHVEAEEHQIVVRYRLDGVLQEVASLPHEAWKRIISRIKLVSGLKINITENPQDGRFTIFMKNGDTDVRVSTIPTNWGESVVMRILKPTAVDVPFVSLGWRPALEKKILREIEKPHGMIVTTGPTGSGKTTTLYAILKKLNQPGVKIITLEDPIEYKVEGLNQSQIDQSKNYTFAAGLRSILRQDPDIIMVGEIRDLETADTAINAALTGHLLLSTVHTNSASGALPRFLSMGVKPFLLAPSLNAIVGQRLVRKVCEKCKVEDAQAPERLEEIKKILGEISPASGETIPDLTQLKFYKGTGCPLCNNTGYKGRIGIYEVIIMDDAIRASLSDKISEYEVQKLALTQGMVTMAQDGLLKAIDGVTSIEEVFRVTGGE
ncbi:MAG: General secretory pathway protein E [Candidatus Uhrbacteria bacterium GW2011_GWE2_45_35]|uniref:General secretory pathway protein E n=2 Tax=Candidatus Uhriibacteriota TaxID=1752732 RepID=A0A0G1JIY4_9BACT|nr:MAG: General secretory pathway protein E [Candidatus Uhrbacteria bacterium GW2011_GWF2_44_350]KKU08804.1 MAG: General secretory pathway protein E [Candidatus Uhrbacteria bacterium GW2011_GWE2_45_35]